MDEIYEGEYLLIKELINTNTNNEYIWVVQPLDGEKYQKVGYNIFLLSYTGWEKVVKHHKRKSIRLKKRVADTKTTTFIIHYSIMCGLRQQDLVGGHEVYLYYNIFKSISSGGSYANIPGINYNRWRLLKLY